MSKPRLQRTKLPSASGVHKEEHVERQQETHDLTGIPLPSAQDDDDGMVFYTNDITGSMEGTNQAVMSGFEVSKEAADHRQYLANHAMRLGFERHLDNQRGDSHHQLVVEMQQQMAEEMLRLDGARLHKLQMLENTKKAQEASRKNRERRANEL